MKKGDCLNNKSVTWFGGEVLNDSINDVVDVDNFEDRRHERIGQS